MVKDLIVIGGGPGGYAAALRAAGLGAKVTLVEREQLGGTCLNRGCIPTKALYKNAQVMRTIREASNFGISLSGYELDFSAVQARKQKIVQQLRSGMEQLVNHAGIQVVNGSGRLIDRHTVAVTAADGSVEKIKGSRILLAAGSEDAGLTVPGADLPGVLTTKDILEIKQIPSQLVIIGAGAAGIELAGIFEAFGSRVTVLEALPCILHFMDKDISKRLAVLLKQKGIRIKTGVQIQRIRRDENGLSVLTAGKQGEEEFSAEVVLTAAGRKVNIESLNLAEAGVACEHNRIPVDDGYATSVPGVYAVGDVIGGKMLAHKALAEGKVAVKNMFGLAAAVRNRAIPSCVFALQEAAAVGLTEQEARDRGIPLLVGSSPFTNNGKALIMGENDGFLKVMADAENKKILGVHILGPQATELIQVGTMAVELGLSAEDIERVMQAHPTLGESFLEAVLRLELKSV
ncbi:Dihydrolipoamide dehydrogenase [Dehalobacter sp. UNSWDHB]|uniref:dihydrolipoyl dehydrogenase n=1 Tax=Dehalobacter sp. UNSWDHB TaxID=1339256 RepID=UPI0003878FBD|nr:dihydrolipoyl dehydrogenase [Dehalobacter sp. UNSWDHB]EQB22698.1 Dihydrolipoamide dehydrogenase [Dehalobacter sp. UNSWDHB]